MEAHDAQAKVSVYTFSLQQKSCLIVGAIKQPYGFMSTHIIAQYPTFASRKSRSRQAVCKWLVSRILLGIYKLLDGKSHQKNHCVNSGLEKHLINKIISQEGKGYEEN